MPFSIERNDLSAIAADAIVVAANEHLKITGGVGMTVALAAGYDELQAACDRIGFCPCGSAVATPAFGLRARIVVHAVGPVWRGGERGEADFLRSAYDAALECAASHGARSIALPLISAGTYGFPADVSLAVARESIRAFLNRHDEVNVRLVLYSRESVRAGMAAYLDIAEYIDDNYVQGYADMGSIVMGEEDTQFYRPEWDEMPYTQAPVPMSNAPEPKGRRVRRAGGLFQQLGETLLERRHRRNEAFEEDAAIDEVEKRVQAGAPAATEAPAAAAPPAPAATEAPISITTRYGAAEPAAAPAPSSEMAQASAPLLDAAQPVSLEELLDSLDASFSTTLLALIDERDMTDAQVYKRANMSRQLFSKIRSDVDYRPTKKTVLALAIALGLDLDDTRDLLARAGFALAHSSKSDVIVEYFIAQGNHDIFEINEALYAFDQPLL